MADDLLTSDQRKSGLVPSPASSRLQHGRARRAGVPTYIAAVESPPELTHTIAGLEALPLEGLVLHWRNYLGGSPPRHLPRWLMARLLAYRLQAQVRGDLSPATLRLIRGRGGKGGRESSGLKLFQTRSAALRQGGALRPGSILIREWQGRLEQVMVLEEGFAWQGRSYPSLSAVAKAITGTSWNGHRFFSLAQKKPASAKRTRCSPSPSAAPVPAEVRP